MLCIGISRVIRAQNLRGTGGFGLLCHPVLDTGYVCIHTWLYSFSRIIAILSPVINEIVL